MIEEKMNSALNNPIWIDKEKQATVHEYIK